MPLPKTSNSPTNDHDSSSVGTFDSDSDYDDSDDDEALEMRRIARLPEHVRHALQLRLKKAKHSEFYWKLINLNDKISLYKELFYSKQPKYESLYMKHKKKKANLLELIK